MNIYSSYTSFPLSNKPYGIIGLLVLLFLLIVVTIIGKFLLEIIRRNLNK